jgi:hypothetical protein
MVKCVAWRFKDFLSDLGVFVFILRYKKRKLNFAYNGVVV